MPTQHDRLNRPARDTLIALNGFLAVTALAGGLGLLSGWNAPPVTALAGSSFTSYLVPGLALLILVGGTALAATALLLLRHRLAARVSLAAAAMIIIFETVEVAAIGSPAGVARNLQIIYYALGVAGLVIPFIGKPPGRESPDASAAP